MRRFRRNRRRRSVLRGTLTAAAAAVILTTLGGAVAVAVAIRNLPGPDELFARRVAQSTKIFDRSGAVLLYEIHGEEKRTVIPFAEIPEIVHQAAISIEDANFYAHRGLDVRGIARALIADLRAGNLGQGGSTITQQLVKNALLGHERTLRRKVREAALAIMLEARLEKEDILNLYLNQIPYGSNAYGIEAAAQTFFGKHARELSLAEAALLAALPRAPSYYSPYGQHRDELLGRKDVVLQRMAELQFIDPAAARAASREPLNFLPASRNIRAPHFVMYVRELLASRFTEEEVEQGGLTIRTTLDWDLQEEAERIVREGAERNERLIRAHNMALVAIEPKSGEILAMVGSRDYFDVERDGNFNVATALRQPGSAFKPFVYATAFAKGFTPEAVLFDVPTEFNPRCTPEGVPRPGSGVPPDECYHPQNYDQIFLGPVALRKAIAQSRNVPSVKLLYLAGIEDSIRTAEALGITSLQDRSRFGLSLVLGGAEVRLLDMVSAFGVFATDGIRSPPVAILGVATASGGTIPEPREGPRQVLDAEVARLVNDVLADNEARIPVFQPRSALTFLDRDVAAKTGTTQDYRDAWTIGYTPAIAVGVWAGNNNNSPMQQKGSGVLAAAPSWRAFMDVALRRLPPEDFLAPSPRDPETVKPVLRGVWQGERVVTVDTVSGKLATDSTPPETRATVAYGEPHDPLFWINRADPTGSAPGEQERDPQFTNWDAAFQAWRSVSGFSPLPISAMPTARDDVHTPEKQPVVSARLERGADGAVLLLTVTALTPFGVREVSVLVDGRIVASRAVPVLPVLIPIPAAVVSDPDGEIEVQVYDTVGNRGVTRLPALTPSH